MGDDDNVRDVSASSQTQSLQDNDGPDFRRILTFAPSPNQAPKEPKDKIHHFQSSGAAEGNNGSASSRMAHNPERKVAEAKIPFTAGMVEKPRHIALVRCAFVESDSRSPRLTSKALHNRRR